MGTRDESQSHSHRRAGFNSAASEPSAGSHDLIACSYFSFTSRAIIETDDMISLL